MSNETRGLAGTDASLLVLIPEYTRVEIGGITVTLNHCVEAYVVGAEAPELAAALKRQRRGDYAG